MDLITVIVSAYNESISMIQESVQSILNQTYNNIEIILINDNPSYTELDELFKKYQLSDSRVKYIYHEKNKGLIYSLNEGIELASGNYIARMDADDISVDDRLEKQLQFMKDNEYDMIGCNITKIDENGICIGQLKVPSDLDNIKKYQKYGSCMLHPTWLVKKEVYVMLNGYRKIDTCEDYDFVLRALFYGFKLGNLQENKLYYRIRSNSISALGNIKQKLTMYYLIKNGLYHNEISIESIDNYLLSEQYKKDFNKMSSYEKIKSEIKYNHKSACFLCFRLLFNKYFYRNIIEFLKIKERDKLL